MNQIEMLKAARREYDNDQVQPGALEVLQSGNKYLQDVVDSFLRKMLGQTSKTQIACFYKLKASNVGKIVGGQSRTASVTTSIRPARLTAYRGLWLARALAVSTYQTRQASTRSRVPTLT